MLLNNVLVRKCSLNQDHKEGEPSKLYFVLLNKEVQQGTAGLILNTLTEQSCFIVGRIFYQIRSGSSFVGVCVKRHSYSVGMGSGFAVES